MSERSRERAQGNYLNAFAAANPDRELPILTYERGWWAFRYRSVGDLIDCRVRTSKLSAMTVALRRRVATSPAPDTPGSAEVKL